MADPEEIQEWLKKSEEDWTAARVLLESGEELALPCLFHPQQMTKKLLKALILVAGNKPDRTHDMHQLSTTAGVLDIPGFIDLVETLNLYAVNARYPGDFPDVSVSDARACFEDARRYREELLRRLSDPQCPQ